MTFGLGGRLSVEALRSILGVSRWRAEARPAAVELAIVADYWWTASTCFANPAASVARAVRDTSAEVRRVDIATFILAKIAGGADRRACLFATFPECDQIVSNALSCHRPTQTECEPHYRGACRGSPRLLRARRAPPND